MNTQLFVKELLPLYHSLREACSTVIDLDKFTVFFPQLGRLYTETTKDGILFVGRATNGWKNALSENLEDVADFQFETSMLDNEVKNNWSIPNSISGYRCSRSAFWRIIYRVSKEFYPNDWSEHIAWTNLYKVAPITGYNPSDSVCYAQLEACDAILNKEIKLLSPRYVIFLTSWNWLKDFSLVKTMPNNAQQIISEKWDGYNAKKWDAEGITYILTEHPMVKPEDSHTKALLKLMRN